MPSVFLPFSMHSYIHFANGISQVTEPIKI